MSGWFCLCVYKAFTEGIDLDLLEKLLSCGKQKVKFKLTFFVFSFINDHRGISFWRCSQRYIILCNSK